MRDEHAAYMLAKQAALASLDRLTPTLDAARRAALASQFKAFVRRRKVRDADSLLLLILFYVHTNLSLRVTCWFALKALHIVLSEESLRERFARCGAWLREMVRLLLAHRTRLPSPLRSGLRIVDSTVLCRPKAKGTEWRLHALFEPGACELSGLELTDAHGAEGLAQTPSIAHSLILGDMNYGRARELKQAHQQNVELLVRLHLQTQPLHDAQDQPRSVQDWIALAAQGFCDHDVLVPVRGEPSLPARLIMVPLPARAAAKARERVRKGATKKGRRVQPLTLQLAGYLCLLTTLDRETLSVAQAAALYRVRWQVECLFKRAKSIASLDAIRGHGPLVEVQVWGRLLSMIDQDSQRPAQALARAPADHTTARPPTLWRWFQVLQLLRFAPLAMMAACESDLVSDILQDLALRERKRKRGAHGQGAYPTLSLAGGGS